MYMHIHMYIHSAHITMYLQPKIQFVKFRCTGVHVLKQPPTNCTFVPGQQIHMYSHVHVHCTCVYSIFKDKRTTCWACLVGYLSYQACISKRRSLINIWISRDGLAQRFLSFYRNQKKNTLQMVNSVNHHPHHQRRQGRVAHWLAYSGGGGWDPAHWLARHWWRPRERSTLRMPGGSRQAWGACTSGLLLCFCETGWQRLPQPQLTHPDRGKTTEMHWLPTVEILQFYNTIHCYP